MSSSNSNQFQFQPSSNSNLTDQSDHTPHGHLDQGADRRLDVEAGVAVVSGVGRGEERGVFGCGGVSEALGRPRRMPA